MQAQQRAKYFYVLVCIIEQEAHDFVLPMLFTHRVVALAYRSRLHFAYMENKNNVWWCEADRSSFENNENCKRRLPILLQIEIVKPQR